MNFETKNVVISYDGLRVMSGTRLETGLYMGGESGTGAKMLTGTQPVLGIIPLPDLRRRLSQAWTSFLKS